MSNCTCNTPQTRQNTCFRCKTTWTSEMDHHERVANCTDSEHRMSIAICGGSPPMCTSCTNEGYYVEPSLGWGLPREIKKH